MIVDGERVRLHILRRDELRVGHERLADLQRLVFQLSELIHRSLHAGLGGRILMVNADARSVNRANRGAPRLCRGATSVGGLGGHVGAPMSKRSARVAPRDGRSRTWRS